MIIVCPQCERKHKVSPDAIQAYAEKNRKSLLATCKSCSHKFPVSIAEMISGSQPDEIRGEPADRGRSARKICVTLSKGGVGKTTTSVNLSAGLALAGYRVLLVDTDTQGQSAYMLGKKPKAGLTELLTKELPAEACLVEARKNLWVLGGGKSLAGVKRIIDRKSFGAEWTLSEALNPLDSQFDFIIIDTSPGWDQLIVNVLFYAEEVLVPVALEIMPLHGLSEFIKSLGAIQKYRKEIQLQYIVPTFLDTRIKGPQTLYDELKKLYSQQLCRPIHYNASLSEAPSFGKTIFEFAPGSNASEDYRALVREVSGNQSALV